MDLLTYLKDTCHLNSEGNTLWGDINSFGIVISLYSKKTILKISFKNIDSTDEITALLTNYEDNNRITSFCERESGVEIEVNNGLLNIESDIKDLIEDFTNELLKQNLNNSCSCCNNVTQVSFIKLNDKIINCCNTCTNHIEDEIHKSLNQPNNYFQGTVGAFIGAIIGSFIWIIIGALGYVTSIGGIAIAYASIKGYDLLKGKQNKIKAIILTISIIFGVVFAEYIGVMIASFKLDPSWTVKLWIQQTPYLILNDNLLTDMLPSIGLGLVFAGIGTVKIIKNIFTEKELINKLEKLPH